MSIKIFRKLFISVFVLLIFVSYAYAGWLNGYAHGKSHVINAATGAGNNYPVPIIINAGAGVDSGDTVYLNSKANYFPNDVAIAGSDGATLLDYWWEYDSSTFWVEIADSLESVNRTIYIYYGKATKDDPIDFDNYILERYASNPVLPVGAAGQWDDFWVSISSIVDNTAIDGKYYAYYSGSQSTSNYRVGLATSSDGITWTKSGSNPVLTVGVGGQWDDNIVGQPCVWKEGSTWYMLYIGAQSGGVIKVGIATSTDGITWVKSGSNPVLSPTAATWDSASIISIAGRMLKEGSTYYFYYTGCTNLSDYSTFQIGLATSTDLINWAKSGNNPLLSGTALAWDKGVLEPFVQKFGSTYYMFYQGNEISPDRSRIGVATSSAKDSGWVKSSSNPMFQSPTTNHAVNYWDDFWVEQPVWVDMGTHWRLYFSGSKGATYTPRIQSGYAVYKKVGSGVNTFLLFDDFKAQTPDLTKWVNTGIFSQDRGELYKYAANTTTTYILKSVSTFAYPIAIESKGRVGNDWLNEYGGAISTLWDSAWGTSGYLVNKYKDATNDWYRIYRSPDYVNNGTNESISADTWYKYSLRISAANQYFLVNSVQKGTLATIPPLASTNILLATGRGAATSDFTTYFDWVFVRKYTDPEPTHGAWGAEQNPPGGFGLMK